MEAVDIGIQPQQNELQKKPGFFHQLKEIAFNRFEDPRNCQTLEDVVGKRIEGGILKARRIDWAPRKIDISRMAETVRMVQEKIGGERPLRIVDIAGHSGFLDRLLLDEIDKKNGLRTNIEVTIVDPDRNVTGKAREYYKTNEPRMGFRTEKSQQFVANENEHADIVICSWMRPEMNLRPDIERLDPQIIIFVKDIPGDVGQPGAFDENEKYQKSVAWLGYSGHDIDSFNENGNCETDNVVLIMTKRNGTVGQEIQNRLKNVSVQENDRYSWETQLPPLEVGKIHEKDDFDYMHPHISD